ncbi:MAG: bifunctional 2-polyprenyl-6-hydroxyphenol methylase/3-demethylubiquinol 3-O-methyltransferase UbiG [Thioploca sp.]|nr:bifunctional 2-polyprenyl-6-hydroxyphenol methylase/3-demethylubiquinol 3-O-methyltransferase UbiG [Thioploca sp.]
MTDNIDQQELAKFSTLAARWWDPKGEFKPLHDINPLRLKYVEQQADGLLGKTVLDVGCGGGILSESMARHGAQVTGIDMGESVLKVAKLHLYESGLDIDYQYTTVEQLAQAYPARFDVVTCMEMLEHVPNPLSVVMACYQLVKPAGHVFLSTINRNLKSYLFAIIGAEYILKLLPKGTHNYAKFIQPAELAEWVRTANLILRAMIGINYNPLTQHYSLSQDISVNYIIHAQRDL